MAGFEVVVRPVVFPNIRPAPARSLPPEDDPTKGFCVIKGSSGKVIDLPFSWNVSTSKSRAIETERRVDEVRIYQEEDDGTINKKNFVDVKVANRITTKEPGRGGPVPDVGIGSGTPGVGSNLSFEERITFFKKADETRNQEIKKRDQIEKNPSPAN